MPAVVFFVSGNGVFMALEEKEKLEKNYAGAPGQGGQGKPGGPVGPGGRGGKDFLGTEPTGALLRKFTIPSIVAMLVGSLYNIVDQFFIGQSVGHLGNAATNIAFPLGTLCIATALLCGIGGASAFNISMGRGERDTAVNYMGNAAVMMVGIGVLMILIVEIFLTPILRFFGSPADVLPYAQEYARITALGFPFLILTSGGGHLVRADGRPTTSMLCNLSGALINVVLDWLFVFIFHWGMAGAAAATIIGQYISGGLIIWNLAHCRSVKLSADNLRIRREYAGYILQLGASPCSNQLAMAVVQIVMNNSLKYYGARSIYGESIPIAVSGVINKVNMIFMSFIIGLSQGSQPIVSFNYGACKYDRVKRTYRQAITVGAGIAAFAFLMFQILPRQITQIFGDGSAEYYRFAVRYFRIFLFFTFLNFLQPLTSNFFTAIGKPRIGIVLSLSRQVLLLLPMILIMPLIFGIDGIMYAGPVADFTAAFLCFLFVRKEFARPEYRQAAGEAVNRRDSESIGVNRRDR